MKKSVISTSFTMTERKAVNIRLSKQRLTAWPNAFINMKAPKYEIKGGGKIL